MYCPLALFDELMISCAFSSARRCKFLPLLPLQILASDLQPLTFASHTYPTFHLLMPLYGESSEMVLRIGMRARCASGVCGRGVGQGLTAG